MPSVKSQLQLENYAVIQFNKQWDAGKFKGQRYGQAFYNHFRLDRIVDQAQLRDLCQTSDNKQARALIKHIFKLN